MPSPDAAASADGGGRGGEFLPPLRAGSDDEPAAPSPATAPPPFHAESEPPASEVGGRRAAAVARFGDGDEELDALLGDLGAGAGSASAPEAVGNDGGPVPPIPTPTLARLYAEQGFADRAAHVYRQVLEVRPDDAEARAALAGLEGH